MREIKFRAKQTKPVQSIWHYGDLLHSRDNKTYIQNFCLMEVDPETVGQYTGLKDRNNNDIYEGDILENIALGSDETGYIEYIEEDGMFALIIDDVVVNFSNEDSKGWEVIGNIHEKRNDQ